MNRAVFLDRDGTIIRERHYISKPDDVELIPGVAPVIRNLNSRGIRVVVVTNQSGIARGMFTEQDFRSVSARIDELLAKEGARIDATYFCPHHPEFSGPCECRKPGTELYRRAIADLDLDATQCAYIGDRLRDISPARELGGLGFLVPIPETPEEEVEQAAREASVKDSVAAAVRSFLLPRVAVLASGGGSNLQAIIDHFASLGANAPGTIALVLSDRGKSGALERARTAGIRAEHMLFAVSAEEMLPLLTRLRIDFLALAGYLRKVPANVTSAYRGRMVNIHPALLPAFGGHGMYGHHVHDAVLAAGVKESGATVHYVDDVYDNGAVIEQQRVPVLPGDTADSLAARVLVAEHSLYPRVIEKLLRHFQ